MALFTRLQEARELLPTFLGGNKQAEYQQLPVSRTSTFSSTTDSEVSEDAAVSEDKLANLWRRHWKMVLAVLGASAAVAIVAALATVHRKETVELCAPETRYSEDGAWYRHPSAYDGERLQSRQDEPLQLTHAQKVMSQACADLWISKGVLCKEAQEGKLFPDVETDVVWTFVEPTEHWRTWKAAYKGEKETPEQKAEKLVHFRSYDEIRYSVRSVAKNLPFMRKRTLLATSLPEPLPQDNATIASFSDYQPGQCRVAQIPEWLSKPNSTLLPNNAPPATEELQILSHWELFDSRQKTEADMHAAKAAMLPIFNSHAIESQLYNIPGAAPSVLYLNNDVYIGREMGPSDLSTHLLGPVYRIYPGAFSHGAASLEEAMAIDGEGNARVMPNTVRLLNERFGSRDRNYADHTGHVLYMPMMQEAARTWSKELHKTSQVRFRGAGPEVWLPLLTMYYLVEKHREALLWSFIVAKSDSDASGSIDEAERQQMLNVTEGRIRDDQITFAEPLRPKDSTALAEVVSNGGASKAKETEYIWTSLDGYPYVSKEEGNSIFPDYEGQGDFCSVSVSECFGVSPGNTNATSISASKLFKRVAFEKPRCGDCLIAGLLAKSGEAGLEAFLPASKGEVSTVDTQAEVPELGKSKPHWQDVDFSLAAALKTEHGRWSKRDFAVRLLQRYAYTFGSTGSSFIEMTNDVGFDGWLAWKMTDDHNPFIAINDHVTSNDTLVIDAVRKVMMDWQETMFPEPSPYEKQE